MTTREEIIALAHECGLQTYFTRDCYTTALERLFHAAQRQAYERAEKAARDAWFQSTCHISDIEDAIRSLIEGDK